MAGPTRWRIRYCTLLLEAKASASYPGKHFIRKTEAIAKAGLRCSKSLRISYTIKEIHELPLTQFDFLIANITDFVQRHKLSEWLYCDRGIQAKFLDSEEDAALKVFLKSSFPSVSLNN